MVKKLIFVGILFVFIGILLGAFAAHGLKSIGVAEEEISSFDVGVRYLFITGLGFLAIAGIRDHLDFLLKLNFRSIFWGTVLFSGSIFLLVLLPVLGFSVQRFIGPVTPIGGVLMILGWFSLLIKYLRTLL